MTAAATDLVFLDIECLGIEIGCPVWEFAAIRTNRAGDILATEHMFIRHGDPEPWLLKLPASFVADYRKRYDPAAALTPGWAVPRIAVIAQGAKLVGSNPSFDMAHLEPMLRRHGYEPPWHYHGVDIPSMAQGYLAAHGRLAEQDDWRSDALSRVIGIEPDDYDRHTAMGDVRWTLAQWLRMTGQPRAIPGPERAGGEICCPTARLKEEVT
jgi:hypothetical protein